MFASLNEKETLFALCWLRELKQANEQNSLAINAAKRSQTKQSSLQSNTKLKVETKTKTNQAQKACVKKSWLAKGLLVSRTSRFCLAESKAQNALHWFWARNKTQNTKNFVLFRFVLCLPNCGALLVAVSFFALYETNLIVFVRRSAICWAISH